MIFVKIYYFNSESSLKVNNIHYSSSGKRIRQLPQRQEKPGQGLPSRSEEVHSVASGYTSSSNFSLRFLKSKTLCRKVA